MTDEKKKNLVLDLDETLITYHFLNLNIDDDVFDSIQCKNLLFKVSFHKMLVFYRPYLKEFFDVVKQHYNIYFYTNATEGYLNKFITNAKKMTDFKVSGCVFRNGDECYHDEIRLKSLKKLGLTIDNTIIIDDNKYAWNDKYRSNIINIPLFIVDVEDREGKHLTDSHLCTIMNELSKTDDMPDVQEFVKSINTVLLMSTLSKDAQDRIKKIMS